MSRKEFDMMFNLQAQMGSGFSGTFSKAQQDLINMQKGIEALNRQQIDITQYEKKQKAVQSAAADVKTLTEQIANLKKEQKETGDSSAKLANEILNKERALQRAEDKLETHTQSVEKLGKKLSDAGVDMNDLKGASEGLTKKIDEQKQKMEEAAESAEEFGATTKEAVLSLEQVLAAVGIAKAIKAIYEAFKECAGAAMDFEQTMAGVRRTVGGSDAEIAALGAEFKALSAEIPISTAELGKIAETAGQLGVAQAHVSEFTQVMAMLSTTTDLTADNAATMLAQFANITGLDPSDYGRLGSAVAELGDATATTASKVVDMSQGIAAAASIAGMSQTDILGISAAVGSLGMEAQAGSTAMSQLIQTLHKAVETGDRLNEFASIANMNAEEFAQAWGVSAVNAMDAFIQGLNDTERNGRSAIVVLDELGISNVRQVKTVLGLAQAGDLLSNTVKQGNLAWEENIALQAKADIMYGTTHAQLTKMQNEYNNLKIAIGDALTPTLQGLYETLGNVAGGLSEFAEKNPELIRGVVAFTGVLAAGVTALTGYTVALKLLIAAKAALGVAATAALGPISLITVGVGLLAGAWVAAASGMKSADIEAQYLTETSREQFEQLKALNAEYETAVELYGETHETTKQLRWEVESLTAEFERNKQTVKGYVDEIKAVVEANADLIESFRESSDAIDKQGYIAESLIGRLSGLIEQDDGSVLSQERIRATIGALNQAMPSLGASYEAFAEGGADYIETVRAMAEADNDRQRQQKTYDNYAALLGRMPELEKHEAKALEEKEAAQQRYNEALEAYNKAFEGAAGSTWEEKFLEVAFAEGAELGEALNVLNAFTEAHKLAENAIDDAGRALAEMESDMAGYAEAAAEAAEATNELAATVEDLEQILGRIEELGAAYTEVYNAALQSIRGQYKLWEEAAKVVPMSVDKTTTALEKQLKYWQDYNANIANLTERAGEIEGLREMIGSFADGSPESVNMIAGLALATDAEVTKMVAAWNAVQEEHASVSDSLAELVTDFAAAMAELQAELEETVAAMDMGGQAAVAGQNTIQGFISGAERMLPVVQNAYRRIAQAAVDAIKAEMVISSPSRKMEWLAEMSWAGYIGKTRAMEPELAAVMAEAARMGYNAFYEESARRVVAVAPELTASLAARGAAGGGDTINITVAPEYHTSGVDSASRLESVYSANNENLRGMIVDVLEDINMDKARRSYR